MTQSPAPLPPAKQRGHLREAASLTQAQVAERVGVSRETVHAWESGRTTPRGRRREAYAKLLASLTKADMVTNTQEAAPPPPVTVCLNSDPHHPETLEIPATLGAPATQEALPAPDTPETPDTPEAPETPEALEALEALEAPGAQLTGARGAALTPAQAFDALYAFCASALVRQAYLLSGRRELARESVERAFQRAWQRWPEVAVDRDPAGWVRATAYEYALSPWHRFRPRYRHPEPPPADAADRALLDVLLTLPAPYRRTLLLYDGVGLDLPETAAETEASTPATANRLLHAREAVAARLPELASPAALHRRLAEVASAERLRAAGPTTVRTGSEQRARFWTRAAIAFTVAIIGATALTVRTAPTRYEPAVPPGETVQGVPPRSAPGTLSDAELNLRAKLRSDLRHGPQRLIPLAE
ncbi:helix-turn-helix domain-containing protein [Streptomyces rishiriensis]|uniref:DNA-directed RNA polymerase specialized sigma24 family protein n=1 Tax=Streptomyces rishiriensis TaxID=68264 RepID=A0ABU0NV45_STRRH|nr:helix-turn-helix domain-containing protein [Streptomyces rishiriensis]MDQ0582984.1 DNA-directed RNA polymerase specialized sigma24 family protein [Streptomyces rishiriensis]